MDELDKVLKEAFGTDGDQHQDGNTEDGVLAANTAQRSGVLQRLAQSVKGMDEYRQGILLSALEDRDEAFLIVGSIAERQRYGVDITPVVDLLAALAAVKGARGGREGGLLDGVTHRSLSVWDRQRSSGSGKVRDKGDRRPDPLG